jgi:hypothetical protein
MDPKHLMKVVNLGKAPALTNQISWGKVSLKSLEITSDNSFQLSAVSGQLRQYRILLTAKC